MMIYRTKNGDRLDNIAYEQYGRCSAVVDILKANRGTRLSDQPELLPAGLLIKLPDVVPAKSATVKLWD